MTGFDYEAFEWFFEDLVACRNYDPPEPLSYEQIDAIQTEIKIPIPKAVRSYMHYIGIVFDIWSIDHIFHDLPTAYDSIREGQTENSPFGNVDLDKGDLLPIMERLNMEIYFVRTNEDDPSVFACQESDDSLKQLHTRYTCFMRERLIRLNHSRLINKNERYRLESRMYEAYLREYEENTSLIQSLLRGVRSVIHGRAMNPPVYPDRDTMTKIYRKQEENIFNAREQFIDKVYQEDLQRGQFTGIHDLQERWKNEFRQSQFWSQLQSYGQVEIPYSWLP